METQSDTESQSLLQSILVAVLFNVCKQTDGSTVSVYGILDGHGGTETVSYAAQELPKEIRKNMVKAAQPAETALWNAFIQVDKSVCPTTTTTTSSSPISPLHHSVLWPSCHPDLDGPSRTASSFTHLSSPSSASPPPNVT